MTQEEIKKFVMEVNTHMGHIEVLTGELKFRLEAVDALFQKLADAWNR